MTTQPRLVNKQFNSPIGLYSEQNVKEVLQREQQMLANGAIGIDFHNPSVGKPANLQNSAVLRLLEEEETRRGGRAGNDDYYTRPLRDVSWPPPDYDQKNHLRSSFKDVVTPGAKRVAWPPPQEGILDPADLAQQSAAQIQGGQQYFNQSSSVQQQNSYSSQQQQKHHQSVSYQQSSVQQQQQQHHQQQQSYRPLKPLDVSSAGTGSPLTSPALNQSPQSFRSGSGPRGWASVQSPVSPLGPGAQKYFSAAPAQGYPGQAPGQYQQPAQQYQQPAQQYQAGPQYQQPGQYPAQQQINQPSGYSPQSAPQQYQSQSIGGPAPSYNQVPSQSAVAQPQVAAPRSQPAKQEPPPSTITLRQAAPVSQAPPPVYSAQPATASLKGGKHLRGDLKWPPENVRQRMAEEQQHLIELSKGPACRPTKQEKDYTPFFEQHALNNTYPGYKIPPGTQFFRPEY